MLEIQTELNDDNFLLYASHHYINPQCIDIDEFHEDLIRFRYLKRLLKRIKTTGEIQERLILNHIIIIYNVFGIRAANHMMFYRMEPELWSYLKTFLIYLNYLPENERVEIPIDLKIANILRKI